MRKKHGLPTPRQVAIYAEKAEITVQCRSHNGTRSTYTLRIRGLSPVTLPSTMDCTAATAVNKWRSFPQLKATYITRIVPVTIPPNDVFAEH